MELSESDDSLDLTLVEEANRQHEAPASDGVKQEPDAQPTMKLGSPVARRRRHEPVASPRGDANKSGSPKTSMSIKIPPELAGVDPKSLTIEYARLLGKGGFGEVYPAVIEVHDPETETTYITNVAVKVMDKMQLIWDSLEAFHTELQIVAQLNHPCIVNTLGVIEEPKTVNIVMDRAEGGELLNFMKRFGLEEMPTLAPRFIGEVILGLEYMMDQEIVHRDIKPDNLLLTSDFHVKIADFGTVALLSSGSNAAMTGTVPYMAPEIIKTGKPTATTDLWSLGCVLYQLFVGRPPFEGTTDEEIMGNITERRFAFPPYFPTDAQDLVDKILQLDPQKRITMKSIKQHPFFRKIQWEILLIEKNMAYVTEDWRGKWSSFLCEGEHVVHWSHVRKERYKSLSVKDRILILTDWPRLFYLDPDDESMKGQVPWGDETCASADNQSMFHVPTKDRVYHFVDKDNKAHHWAAKINHLVKTKYLKKVSPKREKS